MSGTIERTPLRPELAYDAVILSGGRSSRLGGTPKATLKLAEKSLLESTLQAAAGARRAVVVGPQEGSRPDTGDASARAVEYLVEAPRFGGPAAAVAAALEHLGSSAAPWLLVLACDMPYIARAIPALMDAAGSAPQGSALADDGGRHQPLAALYRTAALREAVAAAAAHGGIAGQPMRALLDNLQWMPVVVPPGSTRDVDTWLDAAQLGVEPAETADAPKPPASRR